MQYSGALSLTDLSLSLSLSLSLNAVFVLDGVPGSDSIHLVTRTSLDRETLASHMVTILVEDGGTNPKRNDSAMVNLTLTDVNDNEPIWTAGHNTHFQIFEVCVWKLSLWK